MSVSSLTFIQIRGSLVESTDPNGVPPDRQSLVVWAERVVMPMAIRTTLDDVRRAYEVHDPALVETILKLIADRHRIDDDAGNRPPIRDEALTFPKFLAELRTLEFAKKPPEEQAAHRRERIRLLESPDAEVPLADHERAHEILLELWNDASPYARTSLIEVLDRIPLIYGPWRAIKRIFKESEQRGDLEVFALLTARFDEAFARNNHEVSRATIAYLCRRGWRVLRRIGQSLPVAYPDAAAAVLARYGRPDESSFYRASMEQWWIRDTWVFNHIVRHKGSKYNRSRFFVPYNRAGTFKTENRAFASTWMRTPCPLLGLLERARSDTVLAFATHGLRTDFRAQLRDVEPDWVARLVGVSSPSVHDFVIWLLQNVPKFEQAAFRDLGLHEPVLRLFDSPSHSARGYAATYARTHARDLTVERLITLADNEHTDVVALAVDLLGERDPRKEVGLDSWGQLLRTRGGFDLAAKVLRKSFTAKELTPDWFRDRLLVAENRRDYEFLIKRLAEIHPPKSLGEPFYRDLFDRIHDDTQRKFALPHLTDLIAKDLGKIGFDPLDVEFLQRMLISSELRDRILQTVARGALDPKRFPLEFLRAVVDPEQRATMPWFVAREAEPSWKDDLATLGAESNLITQVLGWLSDVRKFRPADLGLDWLLGLVSRVEPTYRDFATDVLIKGFLPADFADTDAGTDPNESASEDPELASKATVKVDLAKQSFIFTGKMASMPRKDAETAVRDAGGAVTSTVNAKLSYLVIGDEGSPLYGQGKKGSKQTKAESLNASGANIAIISETAFLKMLSGEVVEASADTTLAGCQRLWDLAVAPGREQSPLGRFAIRYLRRHHPDICLAETDRPVDPGAEIPEEFLTWERVRPLLDETRGHLRSLALDLARWEFARWSPRGDDLVWLAERPHEDVRRFLARALLADDQPEHRQFRIAPESLEPSAAYRLCESADPATRALGLELIARAAHLREPTQLYRLTESPDPKIRAFILRTLWDQYRNRGVTRGWLPARPPSIEANGSHKAKSDANSGTKAKTKAQAQGATSKKSHPPTRLEERRQQQPLNPGPGVPAKPEAPPADADSMGALLRRILFEIPPGRPGKARTQVEATSRIRPLPTRVAKIAVVETIRDLALEDARFATAALGPLTTFLGSRGRSERDACLVAVTRIRHAHPEIRIAGRSEDGS